jgi:Resolvase, N terminal domain
MENGARGRMLIGYMRVSTGEQSLDLQRDALARVGCERVYDDVCSGRAPDRLGLSKALEVAREGDALVVWKLDRIGRSLPHVVGLVGDLHKRATSREQGLVSVSCSAATQSPSWAGASACRCSGRQALAPGQVMRTALFGIHSPVLKVVTRSGDKAACQDTRPGPSAGQRNRLVEAWPTRHARGGPRPARAGVAAATPRGMSL